MRGQGAPLVGRQICIAGRLLQQFPIVFGMTPPQDVCLSGIGLLRYLEFCHTESSCGSWRRFTEQVSLFAVWLIPGTADATADADAYSRSHSQCDTYSGAVTDSGSFSESLSRVMLRFSILGKPDVGE